MNKKQFKVLNVQVIVYPSGAIQIFGRNQAQKDSIYKYLETEGFIEKDSNLVLNPS